MSVSAKIGAALVTFIIMAGPMKAIAGLGDEALFILNCEKAKKGLACAHEHCVYEACIDVNTAGVNRHGMKFLPTDTQMGIEAIPVCMAHLSAVRSCEAAMGRQQGDGVWSNGARSHYTGWVRNGKVHLDRVDDNGFRGAFDGDLSVDGKVIKGSGKNDPSSPTGNSASYTWAASR